MHIAIIFSTPFPPQEGIGFYTWNLAKELTRIGHHVSLITRGGMQPTHPVEVDGITIYQPIFFPLYPFHVDVHSIFVNRLIRGLEKDIDVIHLHTPLVKYPITDLPCLITFHSPLKASSKFISVNSWITIFAILQLPFSVRLEKELIRKGQVITSVASGVANELSDYGIDAHSIYVLGNGVDTRVFTPIKDKTKKQQKKYLLTAGRIAPMKGLEDLLVCAKIITKHHPDLEFWVAGSGPYEERIKTLADSLGLERVVRFLGHITDRQKMAALYQDAAGYIHPSHYEGLPTVLLEAMACGCPVVSTAVGGALDVIEDGKNGLLAPVRNPEGLAARVLTLLAMPDQGYRLGQAAVQTIQQRYTWEVVAQKYLNLYQELVKRGGKC